MSDRCIYYWRSNLLKDYLKGWIVVVADSVEAARAQARIGFEKWASDPDQMLFPEEIPPHRDALESDIAQEPIVTDSLFIQGSS